MHLFLNAILFAFHATVFVVRALLLLLRGSWRLGAVLGDAIHARRAFVGGVLHCPAGHAIPTENATWRCTACGFVYDGSVWLCPNCHAVTPYANCPTCLRSVRNPYRWGHS